MILAMVEQIALYVPLICGAYLSLSLMKVPNLSIESAYVFGAITAAKLIQLNFSISPLILVIAMFLSALGGALVGMVAALFSQKAHFSHLLAAIITIGLFHGIMQWIIGGTHITLLSHQNPLRLIELVPGYPELPMVALIVFLLALIFYLFIRSPLGIACAIYGDNQLFLSNYRINQSYIVISGLTISNALAGISGYLVAQSNGFVDTTMGVGLPLMCITALILGKIFFNTDKPIQPFCTLCGIVTYFVVQTLLLKIGFDLRYFTFIQAVIVALLLIISGHFFGRSTYQDLLGI